MLTYVLVSGPALKGRNRVELDERVRSLAPGVLTQVADPVLWTSADGTCLLWTWESATGAEDGPHLHVDPDGVLALSGTAWSRERRETAASLGPRKDLLRDAASLRDALTGSFSAVCLDTSGRGFVTTDDTGTGHVYLSRGDEVWAVSNRAPLAAIALHGRWEPDVESQAWMAMLAYYGGDETSVAGVELLPAASAVLYAAGQVPSLDRGAPPWEVGALSSTPLDDALDAAAHALVAQASAVASTASATTVVSLSGGKDSRLVLAAFSAAGVARDVTFFTAGSPGAADREVALLLGERYDLSLDVHEPGEDNGVRLDELDLRIRRHAFQTAGMFGAWDLQGHYGQGSHIAATGLYGELMRTIYRVDRPLDTQDQAIAFIQHGMGWDRQRFLRPHVRAAVDEKLRVWATDALARGWTPRGLLDLFYADMRIRRWVGAMGDVNLYASANLLQLSECIVAGFRAGAEARERDELHYRLIKRLDPTLLTVPLAGAQWHPSLAQPGSASNPEPVHSTVVGSEAWQIRGWRSHRRLMAAELLASDNALHEVLDPRRLARKLSRPESPRRVAQLWAIWAGSIWASGGYEVFPWNATTRTPPAVPPSRVLAALTRSAPRRTASDKKAPVAVPRPGLLARVARRGSRILRRR